MALGLVLSTVCTSESTALMGAVASFYPTIILSGKQSSVVAWVYYDESATRYIVACTGVMWPFEGMPTWLRYISGVLPATYPAQAMRAIMGRGTNTTIIKGVRRVSSL